MYWIVGQSSCERKREYKNKIRWWLIILFSEVSSGASYEANKEAAKNDNLSAGSRVSHGVDAVKDKGML